MSTPRTEVTTPAADAPEGTCEPITDHPPWWFVKGSRDWHVVSADTGDCDCPSFVWRCSRDAGSLCKHGRALAAHIARLDECGVCHGRGWIRPSGVVRYVDREGKLDPGPWACIACAGRGKRQE
jgi:hypothetical protein